LKVQHVCIKVLFWLVLFKFSLIHQADSNPSLNFLTLFFFNSFKKIFLKDPIQSAKLNEVKYAQNEPKNNPKLNNQQVDFMDVDLNEPSSHHSQWREEPENKNVSCFKKYLKDFKLFI